MDPYETSTEPSAQRGWLLVAAAASLVLFIVLTTAVVMTGGTDSFDTAARRIAVGVRSPAETTVASAITRLGSLPYVVAITLSGAAFLRRLTRRWSSSALLVTSVGLTAGVVYLVKIAVGRSRPGIDTLLGAPSSDYAFPSGHTTDGAVAIVLTAALVAANLRSAVARRLVLIGGVSIAVAVGITRVYLGYHWTTDVIGGWLLAVVVICLAVSLELALLRTAPGELMLDQQVRPAVATGTV